MLEFVTSQTRPPELTSLVLNFVKEALAVVQNPYRVAAKILRTYLYLVQDEQERNSRMMEKLKHLPAARTLFVLSYYANWTFWSIVNA